MREESGGGVLELEDLEVGGIDDLKGEKMREIAEVFSMEEGRLEILVIEGIREVRGFITLIGEDEGEQGGERMGEDEGRCGDTVGSEGL